MGGTNTFLALGQHLQTQVLSVAFTEPNPCTRLNIDNSSTCFILIRWKNGPRGARRVEFASHSRCPRVFPEPSRQRNCSRIHKIRTHTPRQSKFSGLLNPRMKVCFSPLGLGARIAGISPVGLTAAIPCRCGHRGWGGVKSGNQIQALQPGVSRVCWSEGVQKSQT